MYQINVSERFEDKLVLNKKDGELVVDVSFDLLKMAQKFRSAQVDVLRAMKTAQGDSGEKAAALGEAIVGLFNLVFGNQNTEKIIAFYKEDYANMLLDLFPYIQNVIEPALRKESKERMQRAKKYRKHRFG